MATKVIAWNSGTGNITLTYTGEGNGTITVHSDDNNLFQQRSQTITVETTAGSPQQTRSVTIVQAARQQTDISTAVVTAANQTYSGSALTPTPTVTLNGTVIPSTGYDVAYSDNTNAGTATITVTGKGEYTGTASGTFTIAQATGQVTTAPTARNVTYSGSAQYLVTAGSGTGTMYYRYKLSTSSSWSSWSTTRARATNAGTYNIEYYAAASNDGNYTQSATGSLNVEMKKASSSVSAAPTAKSLTYNTSAQALVNAGTASGGTMYYYATTTNSKPSSTTNFSTSIPTKTTAGTYYVWYYVKGDSNHNDTSIYSTAVSVTIARASRTISFSSPVRTVEPGHSVTNTATPSAGSGDGAITYSLDSTAYATINSSTGQVTGKTTEGTVTVTATIAAGTNYGSASASYTLYVTSLFVDMGLPSGLLWARRNIDLSQSNGFTASEFQYNCTFFSWGNAQGYNPATPPASDQSVGNVSGAFTGVYNWGSSNDGPYASTPGAALTTNIPLTHDAARVNLGSPWRMPASAEYGELLNSSYTKYIDANGNEVTGTNKIVSVNGWNGLYIESKINGNRLFIPNVGYAKNESWGTRGGDGSYWSSTQGSSANGKMLYYYSNGVWPQYNYAKWQGNAIRAVR